MRSTEAASPSSQGSGHNELRREDAINETCPWSGKPIQADSLTLYSGQVVGFCNRGCRDKFARAIDHFEGAMLGERSRMAEPGEGI
jgi:hypothetical protein